MSDISERVLSAGGQLFLISGEFSLGDYFFFLCFVFCL